MSSKWFLSGGTKHINILLLLSLLWLLFYLVPLISTPPHFRYVKVRDNICRRKMSSKFDGIYGGYNMCAPCRHQQKKRAQIFFEPRRVIELHSQDNFPHAPQRLPEQKIRLKCNHLLNTLMFQTLILYLITSWVEDGFHCSLWHFKYLGWYNKIYGNFELMHIDQFFPWFSLYVYVRFQVYSIRVQCLWWQWNEASS